MRWNPAWSAKSIGRYKNYYSLRRLEDRVDSRPVTRVQKYRWPGKKAAIKRMLLKKAFNALKRRSKRLFEYKKYKKGAPKLRMKRV